jgi:hypothetical protein
MTATGAGRTAVSQEAPVRPSVALRTKLQLALPVLDQVTQRLWQPTELAERYLDYLVAMHAMIRASVPLMRAAQRRCTELPGDPVATALAGYYARHIGEELHHDDWLLADLAAAGRDPTVWLADPPSATVATLVGAQYYWLHHYHPVCLLGYIAVLEGNAPPTWLAGQLADWTRLPPAAFRTLHHHALADLEHSADFDAFLDCLALPANLQQAVAISALSTVAGFADVLARLIEPTRIGASL